MRKGLPKRSKVNFVDDRRRAISLALDASDQDDCLLIAGKGHEAFQEVQYKLTYKYTLFLYNF